MEAVLIEEEVKKEEQKRAAQALNAVFKEIKKAIKKEKKSKEQDSEGPIDRKVRSGKLKKTDARQYGINPEEHQQLDYSKLFDYLENLKPNQYQYDSGDYGNGGKKLDISHELRQKAQEFIEQQKMDKITGNNHDFENSKRSEAYFWFKLVHGKGITELFYDLSFS